jgi:hypothetical protein
MAKIAEAKIVLTADNQAEAQIVRLQAQVQAMNARFQEAGNTIKSQSTEARGAVKLLSEEVGVHLNRELTNTLSHSKLLGPLLATAFAPAAIIGFIEVGQRAVEGIIKISEAAGGLTEEVKKFMEETSTANKKFIQEQKDIKKAKEEAALAGLSGAERYAKQLEFARGDASALKEEIKQLGAFQAKLIAEQTKEFAPLPSDSGAGARSGVTIDQPLQPNNDQELKAIGALNEKAQELQAELLKNNAEVDKLGGEHRLEGINKAIEEATKRAREFATEMQKAGGVIAHETLTPGQQKSQEIQNTINDLRVAALTMTPAQQQAAANFIDQLYYTLDTQNQKNEKEFAKELRKGLDDSLKAVLATTPNLPTSPLDELKTVEKEIQAIFSAERAGEEALKAAADASGAPIIETEQKIVVLRKEHNAELAALIAKFQVLAGQVASTNPEMIDKAKQFTAELQKLNTGFKTISTSVRGALTNDVGSFFEGIISGSESASQAFKRFAQSLLADLAKIIVKMYITTLLSKLLGSVFGGLSGGGGTSIGSSVGNNNGSFGFGLGSNIPQFAAGGAVAPNMPIIVGEKGPELYVPHSSGKIVPNGALGGGNVQVNVINQSGQPMDAQEQSRHYDASAEQFVVNVVLKNVHQNGVLRGALST